MKPLGNCVARCSTMFHALTFNNVESFRSHHLKKIDVDVKSISEIYDFFYKRYVRKMLHISEALNYFLDKVSFKFVYSIDV